VTTGTLLTMTVAQAIAKLSSDILVTEESLISVLVVAEMEFTSLDENNVMTKTKLAMMVAPHVELTLDLHVI